MSIIPKLLRVLIGSFHFVGGRVGQPCGPAARDLIAVLFVPSDAISLLISLGGAHLPNPFPSNRPRRALRTLRCLYT